MSRASGFRELEAHQLKSKLNELEAEYFDLKFQAALSKLENLALLGLKRKDIARIKTIIHEKEKLEKVANVK